MARRNGNRARIALLLMGVAGLCMLAATLAALALAVRLPWPMFHSPQPPFAEVPTAALAVVLLTCGGVAWGCQVLVRRWLHLESLQQLWLGEKRHDR